MSYIIIYKSENFDSIEKVDKKTAFSLPGDYFVFEEIKMLKQYGNSYKDPFIYLNKNQEPDRLVINSLHLIDIELLFTYNSNYFLTITLYDSINQSTKIINRTGLNHTRAFHNVLSYLVKTMSSFPEDRKWELFDLLEENRKLKNELGIIKKDLQQDE